MAERFKVNYVLVCDDIRQEVSGKQILIGVYSDVILFQKLPTTKSQLFFRVSLNLAKSEPVDLAFKVKDPDGNQLLNTTQKIGEALSTNETIVVVGVANPAFEKTGKYTVHLVVNGEEQRAGEFTVRLPANKAEAERVAQ